MVWHRAERSLPAPIGSHKYFMFCTIIRNVIPENNINDMIEKTLSVSSFFSFRKYSREYPIPKDRKKANMKLEFPARPPQVGCKRPGIIKFINRL